MAAFSKENRSVGVHSFCIMVGFYT